MTAFSRGLLAHRLERLTNGLVSIQGEVLTTIAEAQPPAHFGGQPASPLLVDLLELNAVLTAWHQRLKERRASAATQARIERIARRPR